MHDVNMNVANNLLRGTEQIIYFNNSPDTLKRIFFHTYWNAFQPNSSMDVRSRELGNTLVGIDKEGKDDEENAIILPLRPKRSGQTFAFIYLKVQNKE